MELTIRHYLRIDPADDIDEIQEQYAQALWIEEQKENMMTRAIVKALGGAN